MKIGYSIKKIREICSKGSSNIAQKDLEGHDGEYPIYGASGFIKGVDFYHQAKECIGLVKDGAGVGRVIFLPAKSSVIGTMQYIVPKDGINIKYLGYCLQSLNLNKFSQGATIPHIYFKDYGETPIIVPDSVEEQNRIVKILDAGFDRIEALRSASERILQNATCLFEATLTRELTPKEGWHIYELKDVVDKDSSISYGIVQPGDDTPNGIPVVRPVDLKEDVLIDITSFKRTKKEISDSYRRSILKGTEVLLCVRGSTGIVSLSSPQLNNCNTTRGIVPLSFKDDTLRKFVFYVLKSRECQKFIASNTNGTTLRQINIADVKRIPIPLSTEKERLSLVNKFERLNEKCHRLHDNYKRTLTLCDDLKQALLRKAFSGEL